ncbi:MAG: NUDIX domain-containing protein [Bacteroidales bacterium]|nr:NUDIX domain-containing protein [Bacteroidales bacterium]
MYKVFFNDRTIFLTDEFSKHFQVKYGLFYKYRSVADLKDLISFYSRLKRIDTLFLFHYDIEVLRESFRSCFLNVSAAGGLIKNNEGMFLFMKRRGRWDLPKGKLCKKENFENAAIREVREECGLDDISIVTPLLSTYHTYQMNGQMVLKKTMWFEMAYSGTRDPIPQSEEDITEIKWFQRENIREITENTYGSILDVMRYTKLIQL